jgi:hypothetical protein
LLLEFLLQSFLIFRWKKQGNGARQLMRPALKL